TSFLAEPLDEFAVSRRQLGALISKPFPADVQEPLDEPGPDQILNPDDDHREDDGHPQRDADVREKRVTGRKDQPIQREQDEKRAAEKSHGDLQALELSFRLKPSMAGRPQEALDKRHRKT